MSGLSCCRNDAAYGARAMLVNSHAMVLKSMKEIAVVHGICHGGVDGVTFYPMGVERRSPPSPRTPRTHPSPPPAPPPPPRLSVTMRWAVSGEVLGIHSFRLDWPVYAIRSQAAATIAEAGSGCTPLDVQIMCNGEILLGHTLIQDVDFGPQPEVTVVRVNKIALQGQDIERNIAITSGVAAKRARRWRRPSTTLCSKHCPHSIETQKVSHVT